MDFVQKRSNCIFIAACRSLELGPPVSTCSITGSNPAIAQIYLFLWPIVMHLSQPRPNSLQINQLRLRLEVHVFRGTVQNGPPKDRDDYASLFCFISPLVSFLFFLFIFHLSLSFGFNTLHVFFFNKI
jgi:hypothetical protein